MDLARATLLLHVDQNVKPGRACTRTLTLRTIAPHSCSWLEDDRFYCHQKGTGPGAGLPRAVQERVGPDIVQGRSHDTRPGDFETCVYCGLEQGNPGRT